MVESAHGRAGVARNARGNTRPCILVNSECTAENDTKLQHLSILLLALPFSHRPAWPYHAPCSIPPFYWHFFPAPYNGEQGKHGRKANPRHEVAAHGSFHSLLRHRRPRLLHHL